MTIRHKSYTMQDKSEFLQSIEQDVAAAIEEFKADLTKQSQQAVQEFSDQMKGLLSEYEMQAMYEHYLFEKTAAQGE